jgi:hypothetical protein
MDTNNGASSGAVGNLLVEVMPPNTNRPAKQLTVSGPAVLVPERHHSTPSCAEAVLDACITLVERSGDPVVSITDVLVELDTDGPAYPTDTVYKAIRRLTVDAGVNRFPTGLERLDRHRLIVNTRAEDSLQVLPVQLLDTASASRPA